MNNKNIVLAGQLFGRGGIQTHLFWLSHALAEKGYDVSIFSLMFEKNEKDDKLITAKLNGKNIRVYDFAQFKKSKNRPLDTWRLFSKLRKTLCNIDPDVFLACGTGWNLALPFVFQRNKPVLIFHEVMSGRSNGFSDPRWGIKCLYDHVFAQAIPVGRKFADSFKWKKDIPVLPAFPEPLEITGHVSPARQRKIKLGSAKAAFFSRLAPHKGALWLVKNWAHYNDCMAELHIHGTGPEKNEIKEFIVANNLEDCIFCHGAYPSGSGYIDLLSQYDLILLPTTGEEGAPLVLLEAMVCGVPFVAYDAGGISDYGRDNTNVQIASVVKADFIHCLRFFLKKLDLGEVDQTQLQEFYKARYSYESLKDLWSSEIEKVLSVTKRLS